MPTVDGQIYPEVNIHPASNSVFRVMLLTIDESYLYGLMERLDVLNSYLNDISLEFEIEIRVARTKNLDANKEKFGYDVFTGLDQDKDRIFSYAQSNNIDLIYSDDKGFVNELYGAGMPFQYAEAIPQLENEIESFIAGKNIPWSLSRPAWNITWFAKYIDDSSLLGNLRTLSNKAASELGYTDQQTKYIRALINKAMQIRHCEEVLLSFVQKKNYSQRNYTIKDSYNYDSYYDYSFELNYHLGNLYFLITGSIDVIGRLLTDLYGIKEKDVKPNIEHYKFLEQLKLRNVYLYELYSEKDMNDWMVWIKRKRNYVAHEAETSYTNVIKEKKVKLGDDEVDEKVEAMQKWEDFRILLGDEYVESQKEMGRFVVRMHEDYRILTKDAMEIRYSNYKPHKAAVGFFHPLVDTKADYDKFRTLIDSTARILLNLPS
ncbi:MAG: hypothetical protein WAZ21_00650 [Candidatus Saccharimonadales bacterium]